MLSRLNMKETDMENLFEEEQRLGHICLKPATSASTIFARDDDDDEHLVNSKDSSSSETHDEDEPNPRTQHPTLYNQSIRNNNDSAMDLSRAEMKTGNLLTTASMPSKSPSPLTPSPSPPNESLLQILANQMLKTKQQDPGSAGRLLTIASPTESSTLKRNFTQLEQDDEQQQKWDEAAMALLSLNKPPPPPPSAPVEQQAALQCVINSLLRKPTPPKATIDYHSHAHSQQMQGENFHHPTSFDQWKTLMNYFSMPPTQHSSSSNFNSNLAHSQPPSHEQRGDMMPLKLRMKMLNARS